MVFCCAQGLPRDAAITDFLAGSTGAHPDAEFALSLGAGRFA